MKAMIFAILTIGFSCSAFAGNYQLVDGQILTYSDGTSISCNVFNSDSSYQLQPGQTMTFNNGDSVACD